MNNDKIKILLTGASGSVGCEALKMLCNQNQKYAITVFDKKAELSDPYNAYISNDKELIKCYFKNID